MAAMTRAAMGSAQDQPRVALRIRPTSAHREVREAAGGGQEKDGGKTFTKRLAVAPSGGH
ncbi:hypothetical protein GCM10022233_87550 [Streptomyces shaanxiensis]|uniref:Uncharacterized protein n=1 Tax=Streptomyces shaanxiensis TaxID=653357 RepID=A0ABP7WK27_9ACTN